MLSADYRKGRGRLLKPNLKGRKQREQLSIYRVRDSYDSHAYTYGKNSSTVEIVSTVAGLKMLTVCDDADLFVSAVSSTLPVARTHFFSNEKMAHISVRRKETSPSSIRGARFGCARSPRPRE